jgi:aquaporin Z
MAMIYAVGNISGAHLNPAVSWGFFLARRLRAWRLLLYIPAQISGACLAALLLKVAFPAHSTLGMTIPQLPLLASGLVEVILSALLMFVILNVSTGHMEKGIMAGVAVGGTIMLAALVAGPLTGASMNPARSFGPALISGNIHNLWLYFLGPFVGVSIAAPSCRIIQGPECCTVNQEN